MKVHKPFLRKPLPQFPFSVQVSLKWDFLMDQKVKVWGQINWIRTGITVVACAAMFLNYLPPIYALAVCLVANFLILVEIYDRYKLRKRYRFALEYLKRKVAKLPAVVDDI